MPRNAIPAPVPMKMHALAAVSGRTPGTMIRSSSGLDVVGSAKRAKMNLLSRTPDPVNMAHVQDNDQEDKLTKDRLLRYALDYPDDYEDYMAAAVDKQSKWFSRSKARRIDLSEELPYSTETHKDQAKYIAHVLVHLYIAIKSMDLEGYVRISTKDLAAVKSDIELTLETDFFNADIAFDVEDEDEGDGEDDEVKSSGVIGKVMPRSATVVSVNHWTNELKTCLKMKFNLPLTLRASLAKVYYYLSLARGQSLALGSFTGMFLKLTTKYEEQLSENNLLVLDHQQLLDFFEQFYPDPDPSFDIYNALTNKSDKDVFNMLLKVALRANNFFTPESMPEIFDWSMQRFTLSTAYLSLPILAHTLPIYLTESTNAMKYINAIFHLWTNLSTERLKSETTLFYLLSRISSKAYNLISENKLSMSSLKEFGILTETQMDFILNRIQGNLREEFRDQSYSRVTALLITSITPQNFSKLFAKLRTLLNSLETFVHPSNTGPWSSWIAKFCHRFITAYHKRIQREKSEDCELDKSLKLTLEMNAKFVEAFSDLVLLGSQGKNDSVSNYYISAIGYLADIPSPSKNLFTDKILLDVYDSLTDQFVNSSHRIITSLKQFTEVSRFLVYDPIYRNHITQLLLLMVNKIGTNDLDLTNHVLNTFVTLASIIPIHTVATEEDFISFESTTMNFIQEHLQHMKMHPGESFEISSEEIKSAFKASTMGFKDLIKIFTDKLYLLLETDLSEKFNFKITQAVLIFTQSLSDELFQFMEEVVHTKLLEGDFYNTSHNGAIFANICAAMVKRDDSLALKYFEDIDRLIRLEIEQGAGSMRNNTTIALDGDKKLELFLLTLSEVLSVSNEHVADFSKQILDLILFLYEKTVNPSLASMTSYVLHKTLKNLTNVKLRENRLLKVQPTKENYAESWGAYQFNEKRFEKENLNFEWYVPTTKEVRCSIEIFETIVLTTLTRLDELMARGGEPDLPLIDEMIKNLSFIGTGLSGMSILFDPDFNNSVQEPNLDSSSLAQKLLILRSLRASKSDNHEVNIDIEDTTKGSDPEMVSESAMEVSRTHSPLDAHDPTQLNSMDSTFLVSEHDDISSSRLLTPSLEGMESDLTSVMNPAISFRHGKIYNCNYFFGSTAAEKKNSFDYNHLHSIRNLVGQGLHKVFLFISEHKSENVHLFQVYLGSLKTYFSDVGKESTYDVDDQLFIDYTFLKKVQSVGNYKKPFTRTCLGARIEKYHRQRVILHSTNRFSSKIDKVLMLDLMKLATSSYETTSSSAYGTLVQTMKKIIGSYAIILRSLLEQAEEFLGSKDEKRLESTLKMFLLSKISNKLTGDYKNLESVVSMFNRCLKLDNHKVSGLAKNLLISISGSIKVPSAVALFNEGEIDLAIRPPDKCIDLEISAVKIAKDSKRVEYINCLENFQVFILSLITEDSHWQHKFAYLNFLTSLQEFYELRTTPEVLTHLVNDSLSHPTLVRHCLKWFSKLVDKIMHFSTFEYSLENSFELNYLRPGMVEVDTSENFQKTFEREMNNFDNPNFFVDGKISSGWLFWGKKIRALSTQKSFEYITLDGQDNATLKKFGSLVDKQWLYGLLKSITVDNESKAMFQVSDISFIVSVIQLSELGFTPIKYQDILDILDEIYEKDDKASVILASEIVCALFAADVHTREKNIKVRDSYLDIFLDRALISDLTPDSSGVWSIICWWLPSRVDFRRMQVLHRKFLMLDSMVDPTSDHAFIQSSRLMFTRSYISNLGWRFQESEKVLSALTFTHPYRAVRFQMGGLLSVLSYSVLHESYSNADEFLNDQSTEDLGKIAFVLSPVFDARIKQCLEEIESRRAEVEHMSAQDAMLSEYFYMVTTLLSWLISCKMSPFVQEVVPYVREYLIPMLMKLDSFRDMCKLGQISLDPVFRSFAKSILYRPEQLSGIMGVAMDPYSTVHQLHHQLSFIEGFFSHELLLLSAQQKLELLSRVDTLLFHPSVEVRTKAASVLSGIIHNSKDLESVNVLIDKYKKILSKRSNRSKELSNEKVIKLHGASIGLGALISAFPYTSPPPPWMPEQVVALARASSYPGVIGKSAKDTLSNFKKLRADTWHIDRDSFTEGQLEDLEGVLWRSYFA